MADLFDVGPRQKLHPGATPAPIGSGPDGETCRSCKHYTRAKYHDYVHLKCGLMQDHWTHGAATDIKASFAACKQWECGR